MYEARINKKKQANFFRVVLQTKKFLMQQTETMWYATDGIKVEVTTVFR